MYYDSAIVIFGSTRPFIQALQLCTKQKIPVRALSVPDAIMAGCGMCLGVDELYKESVCHLLQEHHIAAKLYATQPYKLIAEWN